MQFLTKFRFNWNGLPKSDKAICSRLLNILSVKGLIKTDKSPVVIVIKKTVSRLCLIFVTAINL